MDGSVGSVELGWIPVAVAMTVFYFMVNPSKRLVTQMNGNWWRKVWVCNEDGGWSFDFITAWAAWAEELLVMMTCIFLCVPNHLRQHHNCPRGRRRIWWTDRRQRDVLWCESGYHHHQAQFKPSSGNGGEMDEKVIEEVVWALERRI